MGESRYIKLILLFWVVFGALVILGILLITTFFED